MPEMFRKHDGGARFQEEREVEVDGRARMAEIGR